MNKHLYSLQHIQHILNLAFHCVDFNEKKIFRLAPDPFAIEKLKSIVADNTTKLAEATPLAKEVVLKIKSVISDFNDTQKAPTPETVMSFQEFLSEEEKQTHPIKTHEWAALCKEAVQNGCILDRDNLQVHTAWFVFLRNLKDCLVKKRSANQVWLDFMGELLRLGQHQSVEVIHNFLHLVYTTSLHQVQNEMTTSGLSALIGICLTDGLELTGHLSDSKDDDFIGTNALLQENRFIATVVENLLKDPIFQHPFTKDLYQEYHQPNEEFQQELSDIQTLLWNTSVKERIALYARRPLMPPASPDPSADEIEQMLDKLRSISLDDIAQKTPRLKTPREKTAVSPRKSESSSPRKREHKDKASSPLKSPRIDDHDGTQSKQKLRRHASVPSQGSKSEEEEEKMTRARAISQSISTTPYFKAKQSSSVDVPQLTSSPTDLNARKINLGTGSVFIPKK